MRINITVRNMMTLSPSVANYVNKKVGKLDRYFGDEIEAQVRLSMERHRFTCEITIPLPGEIRRAEETRGDVYVSIDSVRSKLEGQIRKHRTRLATPSSSSATRPRIRSAWSTPVRTGTTAC